MSQPAARYEPNPSYLPVGAPVRRGWDTLLAGVPEGPTVVAIDGPAILAWTAVTDGLRRAADARGVPIRHLDLSAHFAPWDDIVRRTGSPELPDDPDFATLAEVQLGELLTGLPEPDPDGGLLIVTGPGAALVRHDLLWYADLPKRHAEAAINAETARNLGQPESDGCGSLRRLLYIDWPILDRHREAIAPRIDRWIDLQDPARPTWLDGDTLRETLAALAVRPFRTLPTFNTAPWGGHWGQRQLGLGTDAPNTAIGYELIAPESGVVIGDAATSVEVPFAMLVSLLPEEVLGREVHDTFGTSFPIRFDYLDTVDGGNLSVHCHPQAEYMRRVFGWRYTQHETYYIMVGGENRSVYLGLQYDVDLGAFEAAATAAAAEHRRFEIERFVQTFPAERHQLFMIPAGTPHGSGEGNVVLEVSATPYLYSLRFYDWLRSDADGRQRPVHVRHAFANLNPARRGEQVRRDLVQAPRPVRSGAGWREELIGSLPEVFFEVRRLVLDDGRVARDDTNGRFHVLNVVEGDGAIIETLSGATHALSYAETLVVPASVGPYVVRRRGEGRVRIVKALVR